MLKVVHTAIYYGEFIKSTGQIFTGYLKNTLNLHCYNIIYVLYIYYGKGTIFFKKIICIICIFKKIGVTSITSTEYNLYYVPNR